MKNIEDSTKSPKKQLHKLSLSNRKKLDIVGVEEVISFNEDKIILQTNQGVLEIKGQELNIQKLNLEEAYIEVNGLVFSLIYSDSKSEKSILKKLFK